MASFPPRGSIRVWRAEAAAAAQPSRQSALVAALLFVDGADRGAAAARLRRALRAERRLAQRGDRRYDIGRHLALLAAAAAIGGGGAAIPARTAAPPRRGPGAPLAPPAG
jgi:hypothetical protein